MWTQLFGGVPADFGGLWSRDGRTVASVGPNERTIAFTPVDGSQSKQLKFTHGSAHFLNYWSPDGRYIVADVQNAGTGWDIERLDITGDMVTPTPIIATTSDENGESITPNGRLIAYARVTAGSAPQLRVARLPSGKPDVQVSVLNTSTMDTNAWSPDGRTLYFIAASGKLMSASIDNGRELRGGLPQAVAGAPESLTSIDAAPDGRLLLVSGSPAGPVPLTLFQNWTQLEHP